LPIWIIETEKRKETNGINIQYEQRKECSNHLHPWQSSWRKEIEYAWGNKDNMAEGGKCRKEMIEGIEGREKAMTLI